MLDRWDGPAETEDWAREIAPYYTALVAGVVEPMRGEALVERHWASCEQLLDIHPPPATVKLANERWQEFVGAVWKMHEGWAKRMAAATAARRPLKGT